MGCLEEHYTFLELAKEYPQLYRNGISFLLLGLTEFVWERLQVTGCFFIQKCFYIEQKRGVSYGIHP